jgi:hypothetical protein
MMSLLVYVILGPDNGKDVQERIKEDEELEECCG